MNYPPPYASSQTSRSPPRDSEGFLNHSYQPYACYFASPCTERAQPSLDTGTHTAPTGGVSHTFPHQSHCEPQLSNNYLASPPVPTPVLNSHPGPDSFTGESCSELVVPSQQPFSAAEYYPNYDATFMTFTEHVSPASACAKISVVPESTYSSIAGVFAGFPAPRLGRTSHSRVGAPTSPARVVSDPNSNGRGTSTALRAAHTPTGDAVTPDPSGPFRTTLAFIPSQYSQEPVFRPQRNATTPPSTSPAPCADLMDRWKCPYCPWVQHSKRSPDLKRHIETHIRPPPGETEKANWVCCGVPVGVAEGMGVPKEMREMPPLEYQGMRFVGGCEKVFSRKDALARHLRQREGACFGDSRAPYLLGNKTGAA